MVKYIMLAALFLIAACTPEYEISGGNFVAGEANPPLIENPVRTDRIIQVAKAETDILWVIDNSCSMLEEQTALVNSFDSFISYFIGSGLDWHVGVTSTDMRVGDHPGQSGTLNAVGGYKYIDEDTPNPIEVFEGMALMGIAGSGLEKGRAATYSALEVHQNCEHNLDFYRKDALLSVIMISDEHDSTGNDPVSLSEFISWLLNLKEDPEEVTFSSIVCLSEGYVNGVHCTENTAIAPTVGHDYIDTTNAVGGILWDIRDDNWDLVLEQLGLQAAGLKREFFLGDVPVVDTLDVFVEILEDEETTTYNFEIDKDYIYSRPRNSITFITYVPPQFSTVVIEYIPLETYIDNYLLDSGVELSE